MAKGTSGQHDVDHIIEQVRALAKFPAENPNPVLRVTRRGQVLYANEAALGIDSLLIGRNKDRLSKGLREKAAAAFDEQHRRDAMLVSRGRSIAFVIAPVLGENYLNLYGRDVTEEREAAKEVASLAKFPSENPSPVLRLSGKGEVIYANDAAKKAKGLLLGRGKKRSYGALARAASRAFATGEREVVEFASGDRVFALIVTPVAGQSYLNVYGRDITVEKQAKQELIEANESLEERVRERTASVRLLQNVLIAANEAQSVAEVLTRCLEEVCNYTGWPVGHAFLLADDGSGDMVASDIWHMASPRRFKRLREVTRGRRFAKGVGLPGRVHKSGKAAWIEDVTKDKNFPRAQLAGDLGVRAAMGFPVKLGGEVIAVLEFFAVGVTRPTPETLEIMGHIGTQVGSVAERKRNEVALRESQAEAARMHRTLIDAVESISEGFALFDPDDRLILCNQRYKDLLYPGMQDLVAHGKTFEETLRGAVDNGLIHDATEDPDAWIEARLARHRNPRGTHTQQRSSGFWLQINERHTRDGGTVATYSDVTQLKLREAELAEAHARAIEASQAKSNFLANMSHELRTPLNATIGYSELLLEEAEDRGHDVYIPDLKKIRGAGKHLLALINDVLDLSKIEAGKIETFFEDFEIKQMLEEVSHTVAPLAEKNANRLLVKCPDDIGTMHSDLMRIRQVLLNLLSNACKFTDKGRITLKARRRPAPGGDEILIDVADSGIGMTEEQVGKVFDAFTQADSSTTRTYGGTGLGLAITKNFCEILGGEIACKSRPGKGSTFSIRLPADAARVVAEAEAAAGGQPLDDAEGPVVLVVDDDPDVRDLLSRHLSKSGYRVAAAGGGAEGLTRAEELQPDAITLDVLMPDMDGWAVLAQLKENPALRDIPVIMLSILDDRRLGYSLGAADYLTKPVERERLLAVLDRRCPKTRRRTALIVEDDAASRKTLKRMLKNAGWAAVEAENGRIGLEKLKTAKPDVILLDLMMPEIDGFAFLDQTRSSKKWREIPVIVITAKTLTEQDRQRLKGSVEMLVEKGGDEIETLMEKLKRVLPGHRAETYGRG